DTPGRGRVQGGGNPHRRELNEASESPRPRPSLPNPLSRPGRGGRHARPFRVALPLLPVWGVGRGREKRAGVMRVLGGGDGKIPPVPVPEISVVVPVFNEEENLPLLAAELRKVLRSLGRPCEVIFVDDGSTDGSLEALGRLKVQDPAIRIVRLPRNAGQSAALAAGFRAARGGLVVTLDADLQNDPADIPRLLNHLEGYDVVCGV